MAKKIPKIDPIKKEIPFEFICNEDKTKIFKCESCHVTGMICNYGRTDYYFLCIDCRSANHIFYFDTMYCTVNRYKCPNGTCDSTFSLDEFFRHFETPCAKTPPSPSILDDEISRYEEKIKSLRQLKNVGKELDETKNELRSIEEKIKKEETEKNSLEKKLKETKKKLGDFQKHKINLDSKIAKLSLDAKKIEDIKKENEMRGKEDDANTCGVCYEKYDDLKRQRACITVTSCFHSFCFSCLTTVNPKTCPKCRKSFNNVQIQKIF